jgi:hypothetical protein
MSLEIKSKRVIDFYNNNKNISFEEVNIFMVDLLEKMVQSGHTPSLLGDMNKTILLLQNKMDELNTNVSRIQNETQTNLSLKMMEMKDQYIEQLKMVLTSNLSEKISPILKDHTSTFIDKTQLLLNEMIPKNQENIKQELKSTFELLQKNIMKESDHYNPQKLSEFLLIIEKNMEDGFKEMKEITNYNQQSVSCILNKMENSSSKGKMSENILFNILQGLYPTAHIDYVGNQKETGDVMFSRRDKPIILIENKNWDKNVPQTEVQKFIRDCDIQKCSGLFLSQNCGICNKDNFELDIHDGNVLLYVHQANYDKEIIKVAIDIIDHFKMNLDKINDKVDVNTIKKNVLEDIHKEYCDYRNQKDTLQKTIKDTYSKLLKQVDEMKMPNLEKYLSTYYSFSCGKFVCEYCGFVSEKKAGLSAHIRGCKKKKQNNDSESDSNE